MPSLVGSEVAIRPGRQEDAEACGRICYEAFRAIAQRHGFPADFPTPEVAMSVIADLLANPGFYGVVAEQDGAIVGSNFLDERSHVAGLGPITVDPAAQDAQIGRRLMLVLLDRARERDFAGVRLLQAAYHMRSLGLYAKLGFDVREAVATMQGPAVQVQVEGTRVRLALDTDLDACNRLCTDVHGHDRSGEVAAAIAGGTAQVVERNGELTGYTTGIAFFAHTVGRTNDDLEALIGAAEAYGGPGFLVPLRNADLFRWCLEHGLRAVQVMTLMTLGFYQEPSGPYLPSILY
jgi:predicted N-acetyltransferase YhbS